MLKWKYTVTAKSVNLPIFGAESENTELLVAQVN